MHNPPLVFNVTADPTETTPVTLPAEELQRLVQLWSELCRCALGHIDCCSRALTNVFCCWFRRAKMDDIAGSFRTSSVRRTRGPCAVYAPTSRSRCSFLTELHAGRLPGLALLQHGIELVPL